MLLIVSLLALGATVVATHFYVPLARRLALIDAPNARSAHCNDTPSSGGIVLVGVLLLSLVLLQCIDYLSASPEFYVMLATLAVVCATGAVDDWRTLPVSVRLLVLAVAAIVSVSCYGPALPWQGDALLPGLIVLPVLTLGLTWLYNLYNFMDGIDGIAALQTLLCALGILLMGYIGDAPTEFLALAAMVVGVFVGFLWFNWPPAKLFMGDAGSLSAGFLIAWLGLWGVRDGFLPLASWLLLMSPFILDATITLGRRAWRRERITEGHNQHFYQGLHRSFDGDRRVIVGLLLLHLCCLQPLALLQTMPIGPVWTSMCLGLFPQLFLIAKHWRLQ
ncbi:MAG: glycosyltransferase family 4 protein [Congregibacter sp.]